MNLGASSAPLAAGLWCGAALTLAVPPFDWWPLAWVAYGPLLVALRARPLATRLVAGIAAGLVWSIGTVGPWLFPAARAHLAASVPGAAAITITAAWLFGGFYLAALALIHPWLPRPRWLTLPAVWVLGETARTHLAGGAPWSLLGHSVHDVPVLAQLAEVTGVAGLSFVVLLPQAVLAEEQRHRRAGTLVSTAVLLAVLAFGWTRPTGDAIGAASVTVHLPSGLNRSADPGARYAERSLAHGRARLTVWPEGATSGYLQDDAEEMAVTARTARSVGWLLTGVHRYDGAAAARRYFNAAALVSPVGVLHAIADKGHLVPLAETSFPGLVTLERPFTAGAAATIPLDAGGLRIGPLICWDALFPDRARAHAAAGADLLVNLSSDRDLGAGAAQLVAFSRFRAIETRRWLVRASGAGPGLAVDPYGGLHHGDAATVTIDPSAPRTFYVRYGEVVPWCSGVLLLACAMRRRRP